VAGESALQKVIRLIREAQHLKAPSQRFTDRFGTRYTIGILAVTTAMFFIWWLCFSIPAFANTPEVRSAFYRAMTLMVAASPCALVISTPASVLSAIGNGARKGILFKGGMYMEQAAGIKVVAFDKTGTLTEGKPRVTEVIVLAPPQTEAQAVGNQWYGNDNDLLALAAAVAEVAPAARLIAMPGNVGFAAACNHGARLTDSDYLLFVNPDAEVQSGACQALGGFLDRHPTVACVGPRLFHSDGELQTSAYRFPSALTEAARLSGLGTILPRSWIQAHPLARHLAPATGHFDPHDTARRTDFVTGACMLVRRAAFEAVGGLDERYFLYYEEIDLCRRLAHAGWETWLLPEAGATHHLERSSANAPGLAWQERHRSRIRYFDRHHGQPVRWAIRALTAGRVLAGAALDPIRHLLGNPVPGLSRRGEVLRTALRPTDPQAGG